MTSAFQTTVEASRRFLSWWREELVDLIPSPLRRWGASEARRTIFTAENGEFVHYEEAHGKIVRRGETEPQGGGAGQNGHRLAAHRLRSGPPVGFRLSRGACLIRRLELPAAARQDFDKILRLDLERATPFRQQDVYADHFVENGPHHGRKLSVRQIVVKRDVLDPILQRLSASDIKVDFVDCWDEGGKVGLPVNLLRSEQRELASTAGHRLGAVLARVVLILP